MNEKRIWSEGIRFLTIVAIALGHVGCATPTYAGYPTSGNGEVEKKSYIPEDPGGIVTGIRIDCVPLGKGIYNCPARKTIHLLTLEHCAINKNGKQRCRTRDIVVQKKDWEEVEVGDKIRVEDTVVIYENSK